MESSEGKKAKKEEKFEEPQDVKDALAILKPRKVSGRLNKLFGSPKYQEDWGKDYPEEVWEEIWKTYNYVAKAALIVLEQSKKIDYAPLISCAATLAKKWNEKGSSFRSDASLEFNGKKYNLDHSDLSYLLFQKIISKAMKDDSVKKEEVSSWIEEICAQDSRFRFFKNLGESPEVMKEIGQIALESKLETFLKDPATGNLEWLVKTGLVKDQVKEKIIRELWNWFSTHTSESPKLRKSFLTLQAYDQLLPLFDLQMKTVKEFHCDDMFYAFETFCTVAKLWDPTFDCMYGRVWIEDKTLFETHPFWSEDSKKKVGDWCIDKFQLMWNGFFRAIVTKFRDLAKERMKGLRMPKEISEKSILNLRAAIKEKLSGKKRKKTGQKGKKQEEASSSDEDRDSFLSFGMWGYEDEDDEDDKEDTKLNIPNFGPYKDMDFPRIYRSLRKNTSLDQDKVKAVLASVKKTVFADNYKWLYIAMAMESSACFSAAFEVKHFWADWGVSDWIKDHPTAPAPPKDKEFGFLSSYKIEEEEKDHYRTNF